MSDELTPLPELVVVGGPNGSGKTTYANSYLAKHPILYLGAYAIASELSPADPESIALLASREFLHRINQAISDR